jgi:hypothetical protein
MPQEKITGAYRRASVAALDKDANIMPLTSYMTLQAYMYATYNQGH